MKWKCKNNKLWSVFLFCVFAERQEVHCVELRSRRYISDGFCTSMRPITEVVCAGSCIPDPDWFAEHTKVWGREKRKEWRCVDDNVRQKKVTLLCENNETRTYRIKTVRSCKCKRISHQHNQSEWPNGNSNTRRSSNRNKRNRNNNRQWATARGSPLLFFSFWLNVLSMKLTLPPWQTGFGDSSAVDAQRPEDSGGNPAGSTRYSSR